MSQDQSPNVSPQTQQEDVSTPITPVSDVPDQINEIEILQKQCEEYLNGWKRAKADYINFKNEQEKHSRELAQVASMGAVLHMLPIAENFRKAFIQLPQEIKGSAWVTGIEQIYKQLKETLKTMGVEEFTDLIGKIFDPTHHQAVGQEYIESKEQDTITQEISGGYTLHGRVIAPAQVIVNKKPLTN